MKNKETLIDIIMVISALILGVTIGNLLFSPTAIQKANYNTLPYKIELIKAYDAYNKNCEILLDSIVSWDESFMDTVGETDTYCNYEESRKQLDIIINKEI